MNSEERSKQLVQFMRLQSDWEGGTTLLHKIEIDDDTIFHIVKPNNPETALPTTLIYFKDGDKWKADTALRAKPLHEHFAYVTKYLGGKVTKTHPTLEPSHFVELLHVAIQAVYQAQEHRIEVLQARQDITARDDVMLTGFVVSNMLHNLITDLNRGGLAADVDLLTRHYLKQNGLD